MKNTNLQNLRKLLEHYMPKTVGIDIVEEYLSITSILHLEGMEVTNLWNLRDFVVSFFSRELIDDHAYESAGNQVIEYAHEMQSVDLLQYIFDTLPQKEAEKYFACIVGFDSFEAADCFVKRIIDNSELLISDRIYNNAHDKLINPGLKARYTKARKKLLYSN